jgi:hypothetical protein
MAEPLTTQRSDVLAGAARKIREHFGDNLAELYLLPQSPYPEDEGDASNADDLHLVAILAASADAMSEFDFTSKLTTTLYDEFGFLVTTHVAKPGGELALLARSEGVRL